MNSLDRRSFLAASASLVAAPVMTSIARAQEATRPVAPKAESKPIAISSGNGLRTVELAVQMMHEGHDPVDAIVKGIEIIENDPDDQSVGYGGLPNEDGVVELDASVMHGPSHKAGAVAGLQNIKNPAAVALHVLRRTDHVLLVGAGAYQFARAMGFPHEELLTEKSRQMWLKWKENLNRDDDWLNANQQIAPPASTTQPNRQSRARELNIPYHTGTIHCSAVNVNGELSACTSTSGLSWKLPGRVGDSPIIGAGMFCDNDVGSAGATGRGEAVIQSCGAFQVVRHMADGIEPTEACLKVLQWIADHTKQKYLLDDQGRPNFGVTLYALRKDGAYGSATMMASRERPNANQFTVCDEKGARKENCAPLFER